MPHAHSPAHGLPRLNLTHHIRPEPQTSQTPSQPHRLLLKPSTAPVHHLPSHQHIGAIRIQVIVQPPNVLAKLVQRVVFAAVFRALFVLILRVAGYRVVGYERNRVSANAVGWVVGVPIVELQRLVEQMCLAPFRHQQASKMSKVKPAPNPLHIRHWPWGHGRQSSTTPPSFSSPQTSATHLPRHPSA